MKNEEGGWGGRMLDFVDCKFKKNSVKKILLSAYGAELWG